jgi:type IV pilus assembly protein PilE
MKIMPGRKGITLIELLIVVAIVAILASIAVPVYRGYMQRARRADAKTSLEQIRAAQEMRRAEYGSYSTSLASLQSSWGGPATPTGYYNLSFQAAAATAFTARAVPFGPQTSDGTLTIDNLGTKLPADKWGK